MDMRTNRAGRWVRVSGDSQSEEDQLPDINQHCADHDYQINQSTLFQVHGKSAYKGAQDPYWQRVVKAFQNHEIDVIVIWMVDRLDRKNVLHAIPMVNEVLSVGGRIEFTEQPECNLDASDPNIDEAVKAFSDRIHAANAESKIKSKRVKKAFRGMDAKGVIRNKATYGYRIVGERKQKNSTFEVIEDEAKVIRQAAKDYMSGMSLAQICRKLPPTRNGNPWSPKTLGAVLRSETICGRYHQGDSVVTVPEILSPQEWKILQRKMDTKAYRKGVRQRTDQAMLTGMLYHKECGRKMYRLRDSYYCRPKDGKSCAFMIPIAETDEEALHQISMMDPIQAPRTNPGSSWQDEAEPLRWEIQQLARTQEAGWLAKVTELQAEIDALKARGDVEPSTEVRWVDISALSVYLLRMDHSARREALCELAATAGLKFYANQAGITT